MLQPRDVHLARFSQSEEYDITAVIPLYVCDRVLELSEVLQAIGTFKGQP